MSPSSSSTGVLANILGAVAVAGRGRVDGTIGAARPDDPGGRRRRRTAAGIIGDGSAAVQEGHDIQRRGWSRLFLPIDARQPTRADNAGRPRRLTHRKYARNKS